MNDAISLQTSHSVEREKLQGGFDVWFSNNVHSVTWNSIFLYFVEITEQNHEQPQYNHFQGGYNRTPWKINCSGNRPVGQHSGKCSGTNSISATYGQPQCTKMTNKMQLCRIIYYSLAALHVSSDIFAYHQEYINCITASGITHVCRCQLISWVCWNTPMIPAGSDIRM